MLLGSGQAEQHSGGKANTIPAKVNTGERRRGERPQGLWSIICSAVLLVREGSPPISPASFFEEVQVMFHSVLARLSILALVSLWLHLPYLLRLNHNRPTRTICRDLKDSTGAVDHFFDLSVGFLIFLHAHRNDSQAQLKLTVDRTRFRYIRFSRDPFTSVGNSGEWKMARPSQTGRSRPASMSTWAGPAAHQAVCRAPVWSHRKGSPPSGRTASFIANGNTSPPPNPRTRFGMDLVSMLIRHIEERYGRDTKCDTWFFEV